MPDGALPAYSRASMLLPAVVPMTLEDLTPEAAFGDATGRGVRVAVVDSGIEAAHPMLEGCVAEELGGHVAAGPTGDLEVIAGAHDDAFGHGTACAGIIHAIAPEAEVVSVQVVGAGPPRPEAFELGLAWAVDRGFDVINLSLGTGRRSSALALHELCDRAYFAGSFVVTAASNAVRPTYPSLFASVASVACNLADDPRRFHFNPEPPTEFLARGVDVEVPWAGGGTTRVTGNSFAAAHLSGLAALVLSRRPHLRPFQLKTALWAAAANIREAPHLEAGRISRTTRAVRVSSGSP